MGDSISYQSTKVTNMKLLYSFGYYGSKKRFSKEIADMLDYGASTYLEPFGGGAGVLLNKPLHCKEVYAEKSLILCCFWNCLSQQDTAIALIEKLYDTDYDIAAFDCFIGIVNEVEASGQRLTDLSGDKILDIAAACFIIYSMSRDSAGLRFRHREKTHKAYLRSVDRLIEVADRFQGVEVLHTDALDLLCNDRFNSPDVMLYLDPVYLSKTGGKDSHSHTLYRYQFGYAEHVKLLERVRTMQSKILISSYDDETKLYDRFLLDGENLYNETDSFRPWKRYEIEAVSAVARGNKRRFEVIWTNE